jgi:hypothetical protein
MNLEATLLTINTSLLALLLGVVGFFLKDTHRKFTELVDEVRLLLDNPAPKPGTQVLHTIKKAIPATALPRTGLMDSHPFERLFFREPGEEGAGFADVFGVLGFGGAECFFQ